MERFLKALLRIFIILIILVCLVVAVAAGYFYYTRWSKAQDEIVTYSGDKQIITSKKVVLEDTVTCLFMGVNDALTDFIMLGKYDPNTREVNLMSIPRDTYVDGTWDHKINSAYARGYKPENTVEEVEKLTGVHIDYYVLFKTKVLRDLVDAVDGVTVTVPFNMNYEDPYQNLYIHLQKGTQKLNGKKAEQFVRYRSGYVDGDVGRIKTQQAFIKAMIARCLEPQNLLKIGTLVNIVLDNTKTNVTQEIASKYIDDAVAFKSDRVRIETLPGVGKYIGSISYFVCDKEEAKVLIDELFNQLTDMDEVLEIMQEEESSGNLYREITSGDKIRIEVLNNGTSTRNFNTVVQKLNEQGYSVVRVGNVDYKDTYSKIISYSNSISALQKLTDIGEIVGVTKLENSDVPNDELEFTIVLGPGYTS